MISLMLLLLCMAAGYLIGSISTAVIISTRLLNCDVRTVGSGNAGATNMLRSFGVRYGVITMGIDILKGALATGIGLLAAGEAGGIACGIGAVLGHTYPLYFGFRGGKGITVTLGMAIVLVPLIAASALLPALLIIYFTGTVSLGTLTGNLLLAALVWVFRHDDLKLSIAFTLMLLLNVSSHRANIKRLFSGTESRLDFKSLK